MKCCVVIGLGFVSGINTGEWVILQANRDGVHLVMTMSSILRIIRTHSVARVRALAETRVGWTTSVSSMSIIVLLRMFNPA